jgi:hypothetical protein
MDQLDLHIDAVDGDERVHDAAIRSRRNRILQVERRF